jgi:hypothetical protein
MRQCWREQFFKVFYRDNGLGIKFEYAGPRDSQRNGKVEMKFQTLYRSINCVFQYLRMLYFSDFSKREPLYAHFLCIT